MDSATVKAALGIALGLFQAGREILDVIKDSDDLTVEDLQDIIAKENDAQTRARDELEELLNSGSEE